MPFALYAIADAAADNTRERGADAVGAVPAVAGRVVFAFATGCVRRVSEACPGYRRRASDVHRQTESQVPFSHGFVR